MYRMTAFSTDSDGREQLSPQTFFLHHQEVEDFRRDVKMTLAALTKVDEGLESSEPKGFVIKDDEDRLVFRHD